MRKLSVWMLVIALVLGIGFVAAATELDCPPVRPPCAGNLDLLRKTVDVNLHVAPWVELFFVDGSVMNLCYPEPGKPLVGNNDIRFQGRSNTPLMLNFASEGFDNGIINGSLKYYVSMYGGWEWPMMLDIELDGFQYLTPGGSQTVGPALKGKWHGHVKAEGTWPYEEWQDLDAGAYHDVVIITVADAS